MLDEADKLPWWHVLIVPFSLAAAVGVFLFSHWHLTL
jgi:hypothetical protein